MTDQCGLTGCSQEAARTEELMDVEIQACKQHENILERQIQ